MSRRGSSDDILLPLLVIGGVGVTAAYTYGVLRFAPRTPTLTPGAKANPQVAQVPVPNSKLPVGIRNNNPGNIVWLASIGWQGQTGLDTHGFAVFSSPLYGLRAMFKNLKSYMNSGRRTIAAIGARWAPAASSSLNAAWPSNVAIISGIGMNTGINPADAAQMIALARGIVGAENGKAYANYYPQALLEQALGAS